jgi:hypothetical protein
MLGIIQWMILYKPETFAEFQIAVNKRECSIFAIMDRMNRDGKFTKEAR